MRDGESFLGRMARLRRVVEELNVSDWKPRRLRDWLRHE